MTSTWHCAEAWLGGEGVVADVAITERDGVISALETGVSAPVGARLLDGVVLPGLANVHSHAFHRALRGRGERGRASFWSWRDEMYELAAKLTPETLCELATATYGEMLCAGFTAVGEFHYLHRDASGAPYGDPNEMSLAIVEAAQRSGIRLTLLDACYLGAGPGEPPSGVQRRFVDDSAGQWAERVTQLAVPGGVIVGAAIHSVRAVPPSAARTVAAWAADTGAPLHAHVSEQPAENEVCLARYGATPTAVLDGEGALSERFVAVHATHVTTRDRAVLGAARAAVCVCPTTERQLGDGIVELSELREAGIAVSVGTDSNATIDAFEELRCLEGHERLRTLRRGTMPPGDLLAAVTVSGHRALGRGGAGILAVGSPCDLVTIDLGSIRLAGTGADRTAALVSAATAADVSTVIVAGRVVVEDGRHRGMDVATSLEAAVRAAWS